MKPIKITKLFGIPDFENLDADNNRDKVVTEILEWIKIQDPVIWDNGDELEIEVEIIHEDLD